MKFPNHIILDWQKTISLNNKYWFLNLHFTNLNKNLSNNFLLNFSIKKFITNDKNLFKIWIFKKFNKNILTHKNINILKKNTSTPTYGNFFFLPSPNYAIKKKIFLYDNSFWNFFDISFLRKEKIYAKLKYSRVPQYDIVSGGVAALFAGFLGFLICEKFGFELLDSGDFYILMMYIVFCCFFIRPFVKIYSSLQQEWTPFSFKWFFLFYKNLFILFFNYFKNKLIKFK